MCPNKNSTNNILDLTCLKSVVNNEVDEIILPDCLSPDFLLIFSIGYSKISLQMSTH